LIAEKNHEWVDTPHRSLRRRDRCVVLAAGIWIVRGPDPMAL